MSDEKEDGADKPDVVTQAPSPARRGAQAIAVGVLIWVGWTVADGFRIGGASFVGRRFDEVLERAWTGPKKTVTTELQPPDVLLDVPQQETGSIDRREDRGGVAPAPKPEVGAGAAPVPPDKPKRRRAQVKKPTEKPKFFEALGARLDRLFGVSSTTPPAGT